MNGQTSDSTPPCIDLNAAGRDELVSALPGIGPALADRIIAFREGNGPFSDPTDLARVPGIGSRRAERLSSRVSVRPGSLAPLASVAPEAPVEAAEPVEPVAPAEPAASLEAAVSAEPAAPVEPAPSTEAAVPTEPSAAADPVAPTETAETASTVVRKEEPTDPPATGVFVFDSEPRLRPDPFAETLAILPFAEPNTRVSARARAAASAPDPLSLDPEGDAGSAEDSSRMVATSVPAPPREPAPDRRARRYAGIMLVATLALVVGAAGALQSERRAAGVARDTIDRDLRTLRTDEGKTEEEVSRQATELARQAGELKSTRSALLAAIEAQEVATAAAEARSERLAQEVADIAERARRAQARTDARVYRLDEAVKLIDWATTGGVAGAATPEPVSSGASRHR